MIVMITLASTSILTIHSQELRRLDTNEIRTAIVGLKAWSRARSGGREFLYEYGKDGQYRRWMRGDMSPPAMSIRPYTIRAGQLCLGKETHASCYHVYIDSTGDLYQYRIGTLGGLVSPMTGPRSHLLTTRDRIRSAPRD
jgi:hypothetical protein